MSNWIDDAKRNAEEQLKLADSGLRNELADILVDIESLLAKAVQQGLDVKGGVKKDKHTSFGSSYQHTGNYMFFKAGQESFAYILEWNIYETKIKSSIAIAVGIEIDKVKGTKKPIINILDIGEKEYRTLVESPSQIKEKIINWLNRIYLSK